MKNILKRQTEEAFTPKPQKCLCRLAGLLPFGAKLGCNFKVVLTWNRNPCDPLIRQIRDADHFSVVGIEDGIRGFFGIHVY